MNLEPSARVLKTPMIPLLNAGTIHVLPHVKAIGESVAPKGYYVRRKQVLPKYMQLYIGGIESHESPESSEAPAEINEIYSNSQPGIHPYLIDVTLDGQGVLEYAGETYIMKAGEFCFIDCLADHFCRTDPESDRWHRLWIYIAGPCVDQYYKAFISTNGMRCKAPVADSHVADNVRSLYDIYTGLDVGVNADLKAASMILTLLTECLNVASRSVPSKQSPDVVKLMQEYIRNHYPERITLEMMAERFAMDKYYLQKLFTQHVSVSPNEYLISTRMLKAKELLCSTFLAINEIAEEVGIDNTSYFIKQFKHREGVTPSKYRQLMQTAGKR